MRQLWAAISGLLFSMTLAHGGTCHVYQDGADTVQACEDGSSRSPTRTATGAFMANPTQVLIGIPARVNAGAAIAAAGVAVPNGTESVPNGTVCNFVSDYGKFYLTFCQIYDTKQRLSENRNPLVAGLSTFHDAEWLTLCEGLGSPHKAAAYKH